MRCWRTFTDALAPSSSFLSSHLISFSCRDVCVCVCVLCCRLSLLFHLPLRRMNAKKYIGRHLRPSQLAAELLPADQRWCPLCHQAFPKKLFGLHEQSYPHRLARRKQTKLKGVALNMWEDHRRAPLSEESALEPDVSAEFARFRADQQRREAASLDAWQASRQASSSAKWPPHGW